MIDAYGYEGYAISKVERHGDELISNFYNPCTLLFVVKCICLAFYLLKGNQQILLNEIYLTTSHLITWNVVLVHYIEGQHQSFINATQLELYSFVPYTMLALVFSYNGLLGFALQNELNIGIHLSNNLCAPSEFNLQARYNKFANDMVVRYNWQIHIHNILEWPLEEAVPVFLN